MIFSLRMIFFSEDNCFLVLIIVFLLLKIFFDDDILSDDVLFSDDSIFLIWWHFPRHCTLTNVTVNVSVARIKDDMWEQLECVSDYGLSADDSDVLTRRQSARYTHTPVTPDDHRGNNSGGSLITVNLYSHARNFCETFAVSNNSCHEPALNFFWYIILQNDNLHLDPENESIYFL